jgi:predicted transcriptional regulator
MKLSDIIEKLDLNVLSGKNLLNREINGGYVSDMLSDVIAHAEKGYIWVTLQTHLNIIPVASMKEISGIIIVNGRRPDQNTLEKAKTEGIPVLGTERNAFDTVGKLYQLGIESSNENV